MIHLKNTSILITGGGSGIGKGTAIHLAEKGAKIVICGRREEKLKKVKKEIGSACSYIQADITKQKDRKRAVSFAVKHGNGLDALVNNAANDERHNIDDVTPEFWDNRMNTNLRHYFFTVQSIYKDMKKLGEGSIINIGSYSWMLAQGGMPGYTTAKSAIMGLTRTLARDLGIHNIRVNCIVPGWIITERQKKLWLTPEIEKETLNRQCIKRLLKPDDISRVVLFFASNQSSGISAQNYVVDGGIV